MNALDLAKMSLEMSHGWISGLIDDIKDAPLTAPTPNGGNHPLWVAGHLAYSEGSLVNEFIKGEANPVAQWKEIFGQGSQPVADASKYPSLDEVLAKFQEIRAATIETISSMTEADLDKPSHAPDEVKQYFGTIGQCVAAIPIHFMFHGGQISDARRAAGRAPLMG